MQIDPCAKPALQINIQGVSKHFIANIHGRCTEIRDYQMRAEE